LGGLGVVQISESATKLSISDHTSNKFKMNSSGSLDMPSRAFYLKIGEGREGRGNYKEGSAATMITPKNVAPGGNLEGRWNSFRREVCNNFEKRDESAEHDDHTFKMYRVVHQSMCWWGRYAYGTDYWVVNDGWSNPRHLPKNEGLSDKTITVSTFERYGGVVLNDDATGKGIRVVLRNGVDPEKLVCVSLPHGARRNVSAKVWRDFRKAVNDILAQKGVFNRGKRRTGCMESYKMYGWRRNHSGPEKGKIAKYVLNGEMTLDEEMDIEKGICGFVGAVEDASYALFPRGAVDAFQEIQRKANCPTLANGFSTAIAMSKNYCSPQHKDDDFFYSLLTAFPASAAQPPYVHSDTRGGHNPVLQYFVFLEEGIMIPMRYGDILIFNPQVLHGCTQPVSPDVIICSCYCKAETLCAANAYNLNMPTDIPKDGRTPQL